MTTCNDILDSLKSMDFDFYKPSQDHLFRRPTRLFGFDIIVEEPKLVPKLKISESVTMSDEYRAEVNQWLADMFGYKDLSLMPKDTVYMFGNTLMMRPEQVVILSNIST